jgi:hypothetical protein
MNIFWRLFALVGIGWGILVPVFLFWQESNDSEFKRLQKLERDMSFESKPYNAAASSDKVSVTKYSLERNSAEIGSLVGLHHRRFAEYAIAVSVSSASIIVLSVYIFRFSKR